MNHSDLLSLFADQTLGVESRSLELRWSPSVARVMSPALLPQRAYVREGICEGTEAQIACFTTHALLPVNLFVGVPFALAMSTDNGTKRSFPMIVTQASAGHADGGVRTINLVARDPMWFFGQRRRLRTFRRMSALEVVRAVLDDWRRNSPVGAFFTDTWPGVLLDRYPDRELFIQHPDESDREFVERLLRAAGVAWFWRPKSEPNVADAASHAPALELVLFDDGWRLPANDATSIRFHRRDATELSDTIDLLTPIQEWVPSVENVVSFDYKTGGPDARVALADIDQGQAANEIARTLDSVCLASPHLGDSWAHLEQLANVQANHHAFRSQCLRGRGGVRTMAPGTYHAIEQYDMFADADEAARSFITVRVEHFAQNNLPAKLNEAAQALIGDEGVPAWTAVAADDRVNRSKQRYSNRFYCVRRSVPIQPSYVTEREEPRRRRLTGIVVAHQGELTTDALCRTLVRLVGAEPGSDTTAWVRHSVPWGGKGHGYVTPLRAGTEVELECLGPDRLVITDVFYNGHTPPPLFDHLSGLPAHGAYSGVVSRELGSGRQQQLRFDDTPGNISVQLGTDEAASQLSIGMLRTPMRQGQSELRGRGFECRTDGGGSVRTGEALLLSAWKQLRAMGKVLDSAEHQALLKDLLDLHQSLGDYAVQHQGAAADLQPTMQLASGIEGGVEPTVSITAPAGIASTTPRTILSYAGVNIDSVAMQHYQVTAGGQYLMNAGKGAALFAHQGDFKAIAHQGKLLLQSQHDDTRIDAAKALKATASKMLFVADEITFMTTGGAYFSLKGGKVRIGGSEALDVNTAGHNWNGPATMSGELPSFGAGDLGRTPKLVHPLTGGPVEGVELHIGRPEAGDLSGKTNAAGQGPKIVAKGIQRLKNLFFVRRP